MVAGAALAAWGGGTSSVGAKGVVKGRVWGGHRSDTRGKLDMSPGLQFACIWLSPLLEWNEAEEEEGTFEGGKQ